MKNSIEEEYDLWKLLRCKADVQEGGFLNFWDERGADWDLVYKRAVSHPTEASIFCSWTNFLPLHTALYKSLPPPPARTIRALIDAYPEALECKKNQTKQTPLFVACQNKKIPVDVIEIMVDQNPESLEIRDNLGMTPLHIVHNADVAKILLKRYPQGVNVRDYNSYLPLHTAVASQETSYGVVQALIDEGKRQNVGARGKFEGAGGIHVLGGKRRDRARGLPLRKTQTPLTSAISFLSTFSINALLKEYLKDDEFIDPFASCTTFKIRNPWEKMKIVLTEAYLASMHSRPVTLLISCIEFHCPNQVIFLVLCFNPSHATLKDDNGNTPLLLAIVKQMNLDVIEILLDPTYGNQEAAKVPDNDGRFPLHVALNNGRQWNDGIQNLLKAAPEVLEFPDGKTNLYPFMMAAIGDLSCVNTIYSLLRENPSVLHNC